MMKNNTQLLLRLMFITSFAFFSAHADEQTPVVKKSYTHAQVKKIIGTTIICAGAVLMVFGGGVPAIVLGAALIVAGVMIGSDQDISLKDDWQKIPGEVVNIVSEGVALGKSLLVE